MSWARARGEPLGGQRVVAVGGGGAGGLQQDLDPAAGEVTALTLDPLARRIGSEELTLQHGHRVVPPPLRDERVEVTEVRRAAQPVARPSRLEDGRRRPEGTAGETHRSVDGGQWVLRLAVPQALHEHVLGDDLATGDGQDGEQSPLTHAAER